MPENSIFSNYIGPKAENIETLVKALKRVTDAQKSWRAEYYQHDPSLYPDDFTAESPLLMEALEELLERSKKNVPYFHPRYAAQMLKDPSIPAVAGYLAFMLSNPNNHAYEGGPVTTELEMEVTSKLLEMCGFGTGWGHLTSGGSLANLEALWAIRDTYTKGGYIYFSSVSHYSWKRICGILRMPEFNEVDVDECFRMDMNCLEDKLKKNPAAAVVANLGSTGSGSIDDIASLVQLKEKYGFHLHIDAAYGGFFRTIILDEAGGIIPYPRINNMQEYVYRQLQAVSLADSITIDPHKQGLLPYGAGAVLYKDEALRTAILNYAPYTYHLTDKPNIGMFSLEGSRPGAMAAACWLTYKVLPLNNTGVGRILESCLGASNEFYRMIENSDCLKNINLPDLDINCYCVASEKRDIDSVNAATLPVYHKLSLESDNPEFIISKFVIPAQTADKVFPGYANPGRVQANALRTLFMKHWYGLRENLYLRELISSLEKAVKAS